MLTAHFEHIDEKGIPWWAAVAAPMIGIPLLVALLAVAGPRESAEVVIEGEATEVMEFEARSIDHDLVIEVAPADGSLHEG